MFKLNVNSELVQKSAHASYRLAIDICDCEVEDYINVEGMENLASEWYNRKKQFIDLFGGKTTVEETIELPLEAYRIEEIIRDFFNKLISKNFTYKREEYKLRFVKPYEILEDAILYFYRTLIASRNISSVGDNIVTDNMLDTTHFISLCNMLELNKAKFRGMKISKFFILLLKEIMKRDMTERTDELKKLEAMEIDIISQDFSQVINTLKTAKRKQTVVLSVALEDFVSMSYGNGWESCHRLGGLYGQGCIAYALSENVILAYVKNDYDEFKKNWRQVIYCDAKTGFAIGSRQYPTVNENASKLARNMWQKIYNEKNYGVSTTDGFKFSTKAQGLDEWIEKHNEFAYVDIDELYHTDSRIDGHVWSTWHKESVKNVLNVCDEKIICLTCGGWHDNREDNSVSCADCSGGTYYCEYCGDYHREDDVRYVDSENGYVCDDCINDHYDYCHECDEWYRSDEMYWIESENSSVCQNCLDYNYAYCEHCNEYVRDEDINSVNDGEKYVCDWCVGNEDYYRCENCGEYYDGDKITHVDGDPYCEDCLEQCCDYCENCHEYHTLDCINDTEHGKLCDDCYEDLEDEEEAC